MKLAGTGRCFAEVVAEAMESIQVDVIFSSLKELQEEKLRNEKVLAEEYTRRKQLEAKVATVEAKFTTTSEKNAKMKEAMKVAEQKVAQTQAQVQMFEQVNNEKRARIADLNCKIAEEEEKRQKQLAEFETRMTTLTNRFRNGWNYYSQNSLESELAECEEQKKVFLTKAAASEQRVSELTALVHQLQLQQQGAHNKEAVSREIWEQVVEMFRAENEASKLALEQSNHMFRVEELQEKQRSFAEELKELESQVSASPQKSGSHEE